jgi:CheY-like chemotaxis protein
MSSDTSRPHGEMLLALEEAKAACQRALAEVEHERRLKEELEEAVRNRDAVLSVVAHDLRNPLNIISLAANTMLQQLPEGATRRSAQRIVRSAQRADRMIRDLLAISAIETGRFVIETRPVETAELILGALESQFSLAAAASVIVAADVSPELPPLQADEERLLDVLENLIGNAVKFTAPGGSITVGASGRGSEVLIWVKDSGSGIEAEQLPHIFDRFWQAQKKERRGMGLGLSICKATVEAHGGRIWAESAVGVGTTVFFTVPAAAASARRAVSSELAKVLLVDDRPENLLALQAILERPEYHLVTARSGEEALALALRERFAVILLDIAMPGMNGLEVAIHLKELERSRDIPIIFVTAFGDDPQEIHRAYSSGAADYLVKPLDPEIVRKKVAVFVDLSRRQVEQATAPGYYELGSRQ